MSHDKGINRQGGMWAPDPWGQAPLRWYDGSQWTGHTSSGAVVPTQPVAPPAPATLPPPVPFASAPAPLLDGSPSLWRRFRRTHRVWQILTWVVVAFFVLAIIGAISPAKKPASTQKPIVSTSSAGTSATSATTVTTTVAPTTAAPTTTPTTIEALDPDSAAIAAGKIALCQDGNYSDNTDLTATCSGGKGLQKWLAQYGRCSDGTIIVMKSTSSCSDHGSFKELAPGYVPAPEPKDIAHCTNGLYSDNRDLEKTCSANGGVAEWLAPFGRCVDGTVIRMAPTDACKGHDGFSTLETKDFVPTAGKLDVARCADGTYSSNRKMGGTCSSHGGVGAWLATYGECDNSKIVRLGQQDCGSGKLLALLPGYEPPATTTVPPTPDTSGPAGSGVDPATLSPELLDATFGVLMDISGIDRVAAKSAAQSFCRAVDANGGDVARTFVQAAVIMTAEHVDPELIGTIIGAGVHAYCPQYGDALDQFTGG